MTPKTGKTSKAVEEKSGAARYAKAFRNSLSRLLHAKGKDLNEIPRTLVAEFNASAAELWFWDESLDAATLAAESKNDAGEGAPGAYPPGKMSAVLVRRVAETGEALENLPSGEDWLDGNRSGSHVSGAETGSKTRARENPAERDGNRGSTNILRSCYPLKAGERVLAVLCVYHRTAVPKDLSSWWRAYAELACLGLISAQESQLQSRLISQLTLLFEATRLLNSTLDLAELLELILGIATHQAQADRGSIFLIDKNQQDLWSIVALGLKREIIRVPLGQGVAGRVAQSGETINVPDAYSLAYFDSTFDRRLGYKTKSLLCLPITHHSGEVVGVIQLLNKTSGARFTAEDEDFLLKLSGHMAIALEKARLHREALEKQRLEKDLALAREIQRRLLPQSPPRIAGYEIAVSNEPCFEVGGDYYDFLSLGPETLLLVIADVEGKGVSSALVMSTLQATLRALAMHLHSLEVLTASLNEILYHDTKGEKFLSIFLGLVDTRRNGLHYINSGHVPPLLVRGSTGEWVRLTQGGSIIGIFPHSNFSRGSVQLLPGDVLVTCTDGIIEGSSCDDEPFGEERLARCVARHRDKPAQGIVDAVLEETQTWCKSGKHVDDKVLMVLKVAANKAVAARK